MSQSQSWRLDLAGASLALGFDEFVIGLAVLDAENRVSRLNSTLATWLVFVLNAGPSVDSAFHIVGVIFSSVTKEGVHLVPGNEGNWASQAVDLAPAQGAIVEGAE